MATKLELKGIRKVQRRMNKLIREVKDSPSTMSKIGVLGVREIIINFNQSRGEKNKWLPLKHREGKPLLDTGLLRSATRFKIQPDNGVLLYNNVKYGKYHQYGASKIFLPQRKWMHISQRAVNRMSKVYSDMVMKAYEGQS
jgi:phage gpG-like protein